MRALWMRLQIGWWWTVCKFHKAQWRFMGAWRGWNTTTADPRIQFLLLAQAALRGSNYIFSPPGAGEAAALNLTERSAPLWAWGWLYLGFALIGIAGLFNRRWIALQVGHFGVAAAYLAFAVGATYEFWQESTDGNFRTGTGFLIVGIVHLVFSRKSVLASRRARHQEVT